MAEDMNRIFGDLGVGPSFGISPLLSPSLGQGRGLTSGGARAWAPQLETFRRGDKLVVRADLPGLRKEDVNVEVDDGVLTISGHRSEEQVDEGDDFYRSERSYGEFFRALPLPENVSGESCEATFKDGVLEVTLTLPKQQERKARRISVK
jgi:HSP20 family protein